MAKIDRAKLADAWTFVEGELKKNTPPEQVVLALQSLYGAVRKFAPAGNTLRCLGVQASCTWSRDTGLLIAWKRLAGARLQRERGQ